MKRFAIALSCISLLFASLAWTQTSKDLDEKVKRARALYYDKQYPDALKMFDAVLAADGNNIEAQVGRLKTLKGMNNESAITSFDQKRNKAATPDNHVLTAQIKMMGRDFTGAEAILKQAVAQDQKAYMAHAMLGSIKKYQKDYMGAAPHLLAAIAANKNYTEAYFDLGEVYFKTNNAASAAKYWRMYLDMVPRTGKRYKYVNDKLQKLGGN